MTALFIIAGVLLFLSVLLIIPVRLHLDFNQEFRLKLTYLFLKFDILPGKEKTEPPKEKEKEKEETGAGKDIIPKLKKILKEEGFGGFLKSLKELVQILSGASKRILSHVKMKNLDIYACVRGEDAAQAALLYGQACSVIYPAASALSSMFRCVKSSVSVDLDYNPGESFARFETKLSISPIFVLKEGIYTLIKILPFVKKLR